MPNGSPTPLPSPVPMKSSASSLVWHILLIVLLVAGFALLFFKINSDTTGIKTDVASLKIENAALSGKVGAMEEKVGNIEAGAAKKTEVAEPEEPLSYGPLGNDISVTKETISFPYLFSVQNLVSGSEECGTKKTQEYFESLVEKYKNVLGTRYTFTYLKPSQEPKKQLITVFPNLVGYKDKAAFKADFDICAAGGQEYPDDVSEKNLLFFSSCGSGYDDGSGLPNGCAEVQKIISPTLILK